MLITTFKHIIRSKGTPSKDKKKKKKRNETKSMKIEGKILRDLFCFQCSYQFDKRSIYDKHQFLVHNYEEKSSFKSKIKVEDEGMNSSKESNINPRTLTKNNSIDVAHTTPN